MAAAVGATTSEAMEMVVAGVFPEAMEQVRTDVQSGQADGAQASGLTYFVIVARTGLPGLQEPHGSHSPPLHSKCKRFLHMAATVLHFLGFFFVRGPPADEFQNNLEII